MLPNIWLVVAAILASVLLMTGGFWLFSTFRFAKTSAGVPPRRALPVDPTLTSGSEHKQICVLAGSHGVNETSLAVGSPSKNTRVSAAAGVIKSASQSRSEDTDQTSNVASRSRPMPAAAPVVALTEDVAAIIDGPRTNVDAAITPTVSAHGRAVGGTIAAGTLPNPVGAGATSTASDSTVSATPSTKTHDGRVEADPPTEADTAGKSSSSRIAPDVTAADPPSIAAETTLVSSLSRPVAEETALAGEKRVAPNPSNATSVEETAIPAATCESPKATIAKAKPPKDCKAASVDQKCQSAPGDHEQGHNQDGRAPAPAQSRPIHLLSHTALAQCGVVSGGNGLSVGLQYPLPGQQRDLNCHPRQPPK